MRVLIVEDEKPAAERLQALLTAYDPGISVVGQLESIEETVHHLNTTKHPDLMLVDIHLSDGHSFEIFNQVNYQNPVIFTTAYENYALDAFKLLSVDYILKPVSQEALAAAMQKFRSWASCFSSSAVSQIKSEWDKHHYKQRFLGKSGQRLFYTHTDNIAFFRADNKIVFLTDRQGSRYIVDYTLERLDQLLDPTQFFRVNRQYLISRIAIQHIKPFYNNRLRITLEGASHEDEVILSRDRVQEFKNWADS